MTFYKKFTLLSICLFSFLTQVIFAVGEDTHGKELNEKDNAALREFLATKRAQGVAEKTTDVSITGDVRMEYRHLRERIGGEEVFGCKSIVRCNGEPLSGNDFDIEANLWFNAEYGGAWAVGNLQFDNSSGVDDDISCICDKPHHKDCRNHLYRFHGSGRCNSLCLKRAYLGYTIYEGCGDLDIEIGRRRLYDFFESDLEFLSRFDGVSLKYSDTWESVSEWYVKGAVLIVDERVNQFAWGAEAAMFDICESGFDIKYSFMDWVHRGKTRCDFLCFDRPFDDFNRAFNYNISQLLVNYNLGKDLFCTPVLIYAAALYNHSAKFASDPHDSTHKGFGYYTGILIGEVEKAGDWSLEIEWQYLQRNAVPFDDQSGIGLGNFLESCCDSRNIGVGYQGWLVEFLYAITDNLTIDAQLEAATSNEHRSSSAKKDGLDCSLGHTYSKVELEIIYAF